MSEPDERYKQLALFTLILAEVVVTPTVLAGGVYWLFRDQSFRNLAVFIAALVGLIVGFYRVALIQKRMKKNESGKK
jgi:positive regulator of sigma E activity